MPTEPDSVLNLSAARDLVRGASGLRRITTDGLAHLDARFSGGIREVARIAGDHARANGRTTLMVEDFEEGIKEVFGGGPPSFDPHGFFQALQNLTNEEVAEFIRVIREWLEEQKRRPVT